MDKKLRETWGVVSSLVRNFGQRSRLPFSFFQRSFRSKNVRQWPCLGFIFRFRRQQYVQSHLPIVLLFLNMKNFKKTELTKVFFEWFLLLNLWAPSCVYKVVFLGQRPLSDRFTKGFRFLGASSVLIFVGKRTCPYSRDHVLSRLRNFLGKVIRQRRCWHIPQTTSVRDLGWPFSRSTCYQ